MIAAEATRFLMVDAFLRLTTAGGIICKIRCPVATRMTDDAHMLDEPSFAPKPCTWISSPIFNESFFQPFLKSTFVGGVSAPQLTTLPSGETTSK